MYTPRRPRARAARALSVAALAAPLAHFAAAQVPASDDAGVLEGVGHAAWRAGLERRTLPDGSVLSLYYGETEARGGETARLRVSFVPRFACAPGIELLTDAAVARAMLPATTEESASPGAGLKDDDEAAFMIDGTPVGFPVIVDRADDAAEVAFAYNGNERDRMTLRLQIDVADVATIELQGAAEPATFSLLGSRRTLAAAESACLVHVPIAPPE